MDVLKEEYIQLVLDNIQKEIEKHNQEKENIQNEINQTHDIKIKEEGSRDIENIEHTIESYENEKDNFLELVNEKEINEKTNSEINEAIKKIEISKQNLLKEQEQCSIEIDKLKGKIFFGNNEEKPIELREYEADLEKITNELVSLDAKKAEYDIELKNITERNTTISKLIGETLNKYHIQIDQKESDKEISTSNESEEKEVEYVDVDNGVKKDIPPKVVQPLTHNLSKPKPEPTKAKTTKPETTKAEAKKTEPEKTEPEQTKQTKPEQTQTPQPPKSEFKDISSTSKFKLTRMKISPITNSVDWELVDDKGIAGYETKQLNYTKEYFESDEIQNIIEQCQEDLGDEYDLSSISKELDPNIIAILNGLESKEMLNKYVKSVYDLGDLPFDLEYDLRDMYKADMLYKKEKSNINKVARRVESLYGAEIIKDGFFKRAFGKIRSMLDKHTRKKLVEDNKTYGTAYEEYEGEGSYVKEEPEIKNSILNKATVKVIDIGKDAIGHFTSKKISRNNIKSRAENIWKNLKIFGFKTYGKIIGEDLHKTAFKVEQIKNVGYVSKPKEPDRSAVEEDLSSEQVFFEDLKIQREEDREEDDQIISGLAKELDKFIKGNVTKEEPEEKDEKIIGSLAKKIKEFIEESGTKEEIQRRNDQIISDFAKKINEFVEENGVKEETEEKDKKMMIEFDKEIREIIEGSESEIKASFVPKAKVDEKAAVEKVNASQKQNEEVIIENPDGTKQTATRLWSRD